MYLNRFGEILALTTPPSTGAAGAPQQPAWMGLMLPVLLIVIFYFVLLRPQQQRAKQQRKLLETIKSGDKIMTSSGIIGVVVTVKERSVTIRSADSKFEVSKATVTEVLDAATTTEA
jgi:preprotein translocase subunit YajC